jgi:hypothetical protein
MKKGKRVPRKHRQEPNPLSVVEFPVRMLHGEAVTLAEFLRRFEQEWFALRHLTFALKKAGIRPRDGGGRHG